jgi:hypothetical protein
MFDQRSTHNPGIVSDQDTWFDWYIDRRIWEHASLYYLPYSIPKGYLQATIFDSNSILAYIARV